MVEQLWIVGSAAFPKSPHCREDLSLRVQPGVRLVSCPLKGGAIRGLHFVFVLAAEGLFDRSVAEGLEFSVASWIEFLPTDSGTAT